MSRTIYGLFFMDPSSAGAKRYFYVGRSVDVPRRERQHHYAKRRGHEDKYEFIRGLERKGIEWHVEALKQIPEGEYPPDNERWFVIKLTREGHSLTNMRHGSAEHRRELAEQLHSPTIRGVADVSRDRERRKFAASRLLRRKILDRALRSEGIPDVEVDGLLPPILKRRLMAHGVRSIEKGVSLATIISLERAHPKLTRMARDLGLR